jgi:8-amino-7-oxononanoate synthase
MLDFTSALYLGFRHANHELCPWAQLTTGVPAALGEPALARATAVRLARLTGTEAGVFARSTLHAFWDLVVLLARSRTAIFLDRASYPVARWGVERAVGRGLPAASFSHHQSDQLWHMAQRAAHHGLRALIVADAVCTGCGQQAPLDDYLEVAERTGGRLLVDDTQGLGLVGPDGGGSLRDSGRSQPAIIVASLAKAFGAPLTFVGGSRADIATYIDRSETRIHLSPPSLADLQAACRALNLNACFGAARRTRLRTLIGRLQHGLAAIGLGRRPGSPRVLLPVQPIPPLPGRSAFEVYQHLLAAGMRGVLHRACDGSPRVSLVLSAAHSVWHVDQVVQVLATAC